MRPIVRASLLMTILVACSTPTPPSDAEIDGTTALDAAGVCASEADCSDGLFCTGVERCMVGATGADARGCVAGAAACETGLFCDEALDRCSTDCPDADGDGRTDASCGGDDCDDTDPERYPGHPEVCAFDGSMRVDPSRDEDCDPATYANASGDGDHDGDGVVDSSCLNRDASGNTFRGRDCADTSPVPAAPPFTGVVEPQTIFPGQSEVCNGVDDNCNGMIDEGLPAVRYFRDCDGDGAGSSIDSGAIACSVEAFPVCNGYPVVPNGNDCDDDHASAFPGATETCNGVDDDCNGTIDDATVVDAACAAVFPMTAHSSVACTDGACALTPCETGWGDCDGMIVNGCEVDTRTDARHCGMCGNRCGAAASCSASTCEPLVDIDAGAGHTCALYRSGRAVCWGSNGEGQLGDGSRTMRTSASPVAPPLGGTVLTFVQIEAGGVRFETDLGVTDRALTCARTADALYCWGRGLDGQLGTGTSASANAPSLVSTLPFTEGLDTGPPLLLGISAGGQHTVAFQRQQRLMTPRWSIWAWGANDSAQIGSMPPVGASAPQRLSFMPEMTAIAAGYLHSCVVNGVDGRVYCFGDNNYGELGVTTTSQSITPILATAVPSGFNAVQLGGGGINGSGRSSEGFFQTTSAFTCARSSSGAVRCFGSNAQGQLGSTTGGSVSGLTDARDIAVGGRHACALRATGAVVCWGHNLYGQLGNGSSGLMADSTTPVTVTGITNAVAVAAGAEHSCAVLADGTAWCWGRNDVGQLGDGTTGNASTPVRVLGI